MIEEKLFETVPMHRLEHLQKDELLNYIDLQQKALFTLSEKIKKIELNTNQFEQKSILLDEQLIQMKNKLFGKSSEKSNSSGNNRKPLKRKPKRKKVQLPSERYPNIPVKERLIDFDESPKCSCCGDQMENSGLTEDSEYLDKKPATYRVIKQKRAIYKCTTCHGPLETAPSEGRIKPGGSFSDDMIIDISMSKYCDLIPIERYSAIAGRGGLKGLPPHSLIEQTHHLADFVEDTYQNIKSELLEQKVLHADETPHRMLEGEVKKNNYLWGFSDKNSCYFDIINTRSGSVASDFLKLSNCEYLMSDKFSGYEKSVNDTNKEREAEGITSIQNIYCNAHSRRKFKEAENSFPDEALFFITRYEKIYRLEKIAMKRPKERILRVRRLMVPLFEEMRDHAYENYKSYSSKSSMAKAMNYFLSDYKKFVKFTEDSDLPIDNNSQERLLRNPVIGRKTWYGTHSKRGSKTAAILFSLVESCKLNKLNPREYFKELVTSIHQGMNPFTPKAYKERVR